MPYNVQHSDHTKTPITVADKTINFSTSIGLVGQNASGYGQVLAENMLHLLENFASPSAPSNAIEGQLWYDTSDINNKQIRIKTGAGTAAWLPANGIYTQAQAPLSATIGTLWVDLTTQQVKIYNGESWITVGPTYSNSLQTGPVVESILGEDSYTYFVIKNYINGVVVSIISNNEFVPTVSMVGFVKLYPGINVSSNSEVHGVTNDAKSLNIDGETVPSAHIFRKDVDQTVEGSITINTNDGILVGGNKLSTVKLQKDNNNNAVLASTADRSKILIKVKQGSALPSIVTVDGYYSRVGINKENPTATLDILGTLKASGEAAISSLKVSSDAEINNLTVTGTALLSNLSIPANSTLTVGSVMPADDTIQSLGSSGHPWDTIWVNKIRANSAVTITGTVDTATKLLGTTNFSIVGHVVSGTLLFDGQTGGLTRQFNTTLQNSAIADQALSSKVSFKSELLVSAKNVDGSAVGLRRISKRDFLNDFVPVGSVMMWPYVKETPPEGWVFCDGGSYSIDEDTYKPLYAVIGFYYGENGDHFYVPNMPAVYNSDGEATLKYIIKL